MFINFNLTAVDDGHIYIGDKVLIAPNVTLTTAAHPVDPELRAKGMQFNKDIHIGNNVWIGAGAIILPGVTIGDNFSFDGTTLVLKNVQPQAMIDSLYEVRKVGFGQMEITITAQEKKNVMIFDFQGKLISVDGILFDDLVTIK